MNIYVWKIVKRSKKQRGWLPSLVRLMAVFVNSWKGTFDLVLTMHIKDESLVLPGLFPLYWFVTTLHGCFLLVLLDTLYVNFGWWMNESLDGSLSLCMCVLFPGLCCLIVVCLPLYIVFLCILSHFSCYLMDSLWYIAILSCIIFFQSIFF